MKLFLGLQFRTCEKMGSDLVTFWVKATSHICFQNEVRFMVSKFFKQSLMATFEAADLLFHCTHRLINIFGPLLFLSIDINVLTTQNIFNTTYWGRPWMLMCAFYWA